MDDEQIVSLSWLAQLTDMVRTEFDHLEEQERGQQPDLEGERDLLHAKIQGWKQSLANKDLDSRVRNGLEAEWATAEERVEAIGQKLSAINGREDRLSKIVTESAVLERLRKLSDVLANHSPTRSNLEISLHVDKIICGADGMVELRTCKLGALPEVIEVLADLKPEDEYQAIGNNGQDHSQSQKRRTGPRRRGLLHVDNPDDVNDPDTARILDFVADPDRFANLSDKWFWTDTFQIPQKRSWVEENASAVWRRLSELQEKTGKTPSLNQLAKEFGKSRPTIKTAIDIATGKQVTTGKGQGKKRQFTDPLDDEVKASLVRLYQEGHLELKEIAERLGIHRNTVARILNEWYDARDEKRPDGRRRRQ